MELQKICVLLMLLLGLGGCIREFRSYTELAAYHCSVFPVEVLYRLSTGTLAQKYGSKHAQLDCYLRQFVNNDGQDKFVEEQEDEEDGQNQREEEEILPQTDPIVQEYARGLDCLPAGANKVEAVYSIWRFYRYILQHDYLYEWMRARIRATIGYQAERPSAWMDGEQGSDRIRLNKLFSNQFYDHVDTLMFREFLHPIMTVLRKNVVVAIGAELAVNGKPILAQAIESKNLAESTFFPVQMNIGSQPIFTYTLPGVPLLLGGSSSKISWAFTGILVDRSNIEQIQTVGNKFFHHGSEQWIKLQSVSQEIAVKESQPYICKYVHSSYGTLYEKKDIEGKRSEYIARWHQQEEKVRNVFTHLQRLVLTGGVAAAKMEFPFNSLVFVNSSGIFHYVCYEKHPSYFIYPDLASAPTLPAQRWVSNPKKHFLVVANSRLSTIRQESYIKRQVHNPTEEQMNADIRKRKQKWDTDALLHYLMTQRGDPTVAKRKDALIFIYRKAKFLYLPDESIRKECDHLIAMLEKWDNNLANTNTSPVFILFEHLVRGFTFENVGSTRFSNDIVKHHLLTDTYWASQYENWKGVAAYPQCDSHEYYENYQAKLNGTGHNSTCFLNVYRAINTTRLILKEIDPQLKAFRMDQFQDKKLFEIANWTLGSTIQEAFAQFYSRNIAFAGEVDSTKVTFYDGYRQGWHQINLQYLAAEQNEPVRQPQIKKPTPYDQKHIPDQL